MLSRKFRLTLSWLCVFVVGVCAQEPPARSAAAAPAARSAGPARPLPAADFARLVELEHRAAAAAAAENRAPADAADAARQRSDLSLVFQQLAWARSVVGDHDGAIEAFRRGFYPSSVTTTTAATAAEAWRQRASAAVEGYGPRDALASIVEAARDRQIVILNEAHHSARHRGFALLLAAELRKLGFEYLACEAFGSHLDAAALRERGYPRKSDGTYVREPLFADFIRQSLKLGYTPVAYEQAGGSARPENPTDAMNARETAQAANLVERIFRLKPDARVFIFVGFSHLLKKPQGPPDEPARQVRWMAARLKETTGIDPLTIDQAAMTDPRPDSLAGAVVQQLFAEAQPGVPAVTLRRDSDGKFLVIGSPYAGDADLQVFHAPTRLVDGRPDWLAMGGYRTARPVPAELLPQTGRRLVQAFVAGETEAAVAMDQFVVSAGATSVPPFLLPKGEYRFAFEDADTPGGGGGSGPAVPAGTAAAAVPLVPRVEEGDYFYDLAMPGPPFSVVATRDQRWAFVSLVGARAGKPLGIAVLRREGERFVLAHTVATPAVAHGVVLTRDEKALVAAAGAAVLLFDVERLKQGGPDSLITQIPNDDGAGSVYVNVTADDATLFVADERAARITVVDLRRVRAGGFTPDAIVGRIPVGNAPIALTFSPDGSWLYTTSQTAAASWGWPKTVRREGQAADTTTLVPEGAVIVIDVERAKREPAESVVARVAAGGSPVRLTLSPDGERAYVTARNSHALLVFDTAKLRAGDAAARIATVPVGTAPVGVLVVDAGRKIIATNSNRFGAEPTTPSTLAVVDASRVAEGAAAVLGTLPAGAFPRELHLMADGRTVLLTNYRSHTLRVIDTAQWPVR